MHKNNQNSRILAVDLRTQRFGYAVLGGAERLLDWGARSYSPGGEEGAVVAGRRVAELIRMFHPSTIVVREEHQGHRSSTPTAPILKSIIHEASFRSIPLCIMTSEEMKNAFRPFHAQTKHEIASKLSVIFPELLWKLPPKRKAWNPEPHIMAVFDAIALGFAYCMHNHFRTPLLD